jgi:hypothetical protein
MTQRLSGLYLRCRTWLTHSQDPLLYCAGVTVTLFLGCALLSVSPYDSHVTYCSCDVNCPCDVHCTRYSIVLRVLYSLDLSSVYP